MDTTTYIALSRQVALQRQLEVVANNVANVATTGFKGETLVFETHLERAGEPGRLGFVIDAGVVRDSDDGPITPTGAPLDLALQGPGWLAVQTRNGVRYTRAGAFSLNDVGEVVTASGARLLDEGGTPIALPTDAREIAIAGDGTLSADGEVVGRIRPVEFTGPARLTAEGEGLYLADEAPVASATTRIVQGALEGSTVNGVLEMTRLIQVQRAFETTQKMIETDHELERRAIEAMLSVRA